MAERVMFTPSAAALVAAVAARAHGDSFSLESADDMRLTTDAHLFASDEGS
jgi:hypothetical protein